MEDNVYFDRCMDFLARMIEKYGDKIQIPEDGNGKPAADQEHTAA